MSADNAFEDLVSGLDYPMFIITTKAEENAGCLAGFVGQASINPPRLVVMLSKTNHTYDVAAGAAVLVVHFLHTGNRELANLFGEESGDTIDKFSRCEWTPGPDGVPVLSGVRGWVAGRIIDRTDAGDHVAHLLETIDAHIGEPGPSLTFQAVRDMEPGHDP